MSKNVKLTNNVEQINPITTFEQVMDSDGTTLDSKFEKVNQDIYDASRKAGDIRIFLNFESIGLVSGQETIDSIVNSLPDGSQLMTHLGTSYGNSSLYPHHSGILIVTRLFSTSRISFLFQREDMLYYAFYNTFNTPAFTGWKRVITDMELSNNYTNNKVMKRVSIPQNTDILNLNPGRYEGVNLVNSPLSSDDSSLLEIDITISPTDYRKQIIAIKSFSGETYLRTIHTDGTPTSGTNGWKQIGWYKQTKSYSPTLDSSLTVNINSFVKSYGVVFVNLRVNRTGSALPVGMTLATLTEPEIIPYMNFDLFCKCYDVNGTYSGIATVAVYQDGIIKIWDIPANTYGIKVNGSYLANKDANSL